MKPNVVAPLVLAAVASAAVAVTPALWRNVTEAGFAEGQFDGTVVTSRGEIRLSRQVEVRMASEAAPAVVSAVAATEAAVYVAAGSDNVVHKLAGGKAEQFAELPGAVVASLVWTGESLLAGTGGAGDGKDGAGIYDIDAEGRVKRLWSDPAVRYVWAIVPAGRGTLYAATGPEGKVFRIDAAGKAEVLYEAGKLARNVLCLALSPAGLLYAGTDANGLVVEIDPRTKASRIVLDADEKEISALLVDGAGGLYVATSDAAKAAPDGSVARTGAKAGRAAGPPPEAPEGGPDEEGAEPASGPAPATAPAEPAAPPPAGPAPEGPAPAEPPAPAPAAAPPAEPAASPPATMPAAPAPAKAPVSSPAPAAAPVPVPRNGPPVAVRVVAPPAGGERPPGARPPTPPSAQGNAVYHVQADGLVKDVFRRPVLILAMVLAEGRLLLGSGNGGVIWSVSPDGDEVAQVADTDAKQVTALAVAPGGEVYFGTANKGSVCLLGRGFAKTGTYVSKVLDAKQRARWGTVQVASSVPPAGKLTVATRSGNVAEPDEKTWSDWSPEAPVDGFVPLASPAGRFLQYRLSFSGDGAVTPVADDVRIVYQVGNLAPIVPGVMVQPSSKGKDGPPLPGPMVYRHVVVQAADPNGDKMTFDLEFREVGAEGWIGIAEKLAEPLFVWDTRTVGDGRYELRISVTDAPSNPPEAALTTRRISEPVVVDNTAPVVADLAAKVQDGKVLLTGSAADASQLASIHYAVDSQDEWVAVLPADGIADSNAEKFSVEIAGLKPGPHRLAVRVADVFDNVGFAAVTVTVGK